MNKSLIVVVRESATYTISRDCDFGAKLAHAVESFDRTRVPQTVSVGAFGSTAKVVGGDFPGATQVYVVQENDAERVTSDRGSQAALDAMVNVLRGHGYQCIRSSRKERSNA
ncbi:hypothetical protein [Ensifer canadensis]|uniref:hypothetical protein n=1 Tax=Ensifer canadensis TaxID=555315 RepID=UPI0035E3CBFD